MSYRRNYHRKESITIPINGKWLGAFAALAVVVLLFVLLPGLGPMRWILQAFYLNPVGCSTLVVGLLILLISLGLEHRIVAVTLGTLGTLVTCFSIGWFIFSHAFMMYGLYQETRYEFVQEPQPITEFRGSSYMEAKENFKDQNPEAQYDFHDLDYVRGRWIADFSPKAGLTPLTKHTAGFFLYNPGASDPVEVRRQEMPYAEGGWLWNSDVVWIHNKVPFATYSEIIYVDDPDSDGGQMAVVSLIKRRGVVRIPYVGKVMLIHGNGRYEELTPEEAEKDPRLDDVQITPEWLAETRCLAYGWREGPFEASFLMNKDRIDVQASQINQENSPPYHLQTVKGMMWFTPFAPKGKESLKGICTEFSGELDGTVAIWKLPGDQAWKGADALATQIKGVPNRSQAINWLRVSNVEGGQARSGDTDIVELLPCPRMEDGKVVLYSCGYVATDPPKATRFYTIINVETKAVLQDLYTISDVNKWLQGGLDVPILYQQGVTDLRSQPSSAVPTSKAECGDPASLSNEQLIRCIRLYAEELEKRK